MPGLLAPYLEKSALERKAGGFLSGTNDTIAVKTCLLYTSDAADDWLVV